MLLRQPLATCIGIIIYLILSQNSIAAVTVKRAESIIDYNQPVQLTIESDAVFGAMPDFSVLEPNFVISERHASYNTRRFNGQTQQQTTWYLTLYPKRSGDLTIPPLRIGTDESEPISLRVISANPSDNSSPSIPNASSTIPTYSSNDQDFRAKSHSEPVTNSELVSQVSNHSNIWFWLNLVTTLGWLATAFGWWYQQHHAKFHHVPTITIETATDFVPSPQYPTLEMLIADIKRAYQNIDQFAARNALLLWAARTWPDDPPTNLSRLAARSNPQLQRAILVLEQSLYSPEPVAWHKQPAWEFIENS